MNYFGVFKRKGQADGQGGHESLLPQAESGFVNPEFQNRNRQQNLPDPFVGNRPNFNDVTTLKKSMSVRPKGILNSDIPNYLNQNARALSVRVGETKVLNNIVEKPSLEIPKTRRSSFVDSMEFTKQAQILQDQQKWDLNSRIFWYLIFGILVLGILTYSVEALSIDFCIGILKVWKLFVVIGSLSVTIILGQLCGRGVLKMSKRLLHHRIYWYFIIPIRHRIRLFLTINFEWIVLHFLMTQLQIGNCAGTTDIQIHYASLMLNRACLSALLLSLCSIMQRLVVRILASYDNNVKHFDRGLVSLFQEFVVIVLYTSKEGDSTQIDDLVMQWHLPLVRSLEDPEFSQQFQVKDALEKHIELHGLKFFDDVIKRDKSSQELRQEAEHVTNGVFQNINQRTMQKRSKSQPDRTEIQKDFQPSDSMSNINNFINNKLSLGSIRSQDTQENKGQPEVAQVMKEYITKKDFAVFFPDAILNRAYELFDRDGNGQISYEEMKDVIYKIYEDRANLRRTIQNQNSIFGKLESVFGFFFYLIAGLTILLIFQQNIGQVWTIFTGSSAIIALVLAEPIKSFVQSILFIFLVRPFECGDWVIIGDDFFQVLEVHLLNMVFKRADGRRYYYPNNTLFTTRINNLTKSEGMLDLFTFLTDMETDRKALKQLNDRLCKFVRANPLEFHELFIFQMSTVMPNKIKIDIMVQYKHNMTDLKMFVEKAKFHQEAMEIISSLPIHYNPPKQGISFEEQQMKQVHGLFGNGLDAGMTQ